MTGEPTLPGLVSVKVSVVQSPIAPPMPLVAAAWMVVPTTGPAMLNVYIGNKAKVCALNS